MTEPINLFAIAGAVAQAFKVPREKISGPDKDRKTAIARFASAYLMKTMRPDVTIDRISALLGRRDLSTVRHSIRKGREFIHIEPDFGVKLEEARRIALSWRAGEPLPGFIDVRVPKVARKGGRPPVVKIVPPRPIDKPIELGAVCSEDYASPVWWKRNDDNIRLALMQAHPELVGE